MAVDGYMYFLDYLDKYMESESQVEVPDTDPMFDKFKFGAAYKASPKGLFEVEDFSFDIEQTLNIGSQSTGAGAGRVTFNAFQINRKIDKSSPRLFEMACSGTPFKQVGLGLRKGAGGKMSGKVYLVFIFKLVAVKTIGWTYDDESPKEAVSFEYGGLQVHYGQQNPDGSLLKVFPGGWNRVLNRQDTEDKEIK